jgi:uncharacterized protein (DUF4213/DUF364 family)
MVNRSPGIHYEFFMQAISDLITKAHLSHQDQKVDDVLIGLHWTMVTTKTSGLAATIGDAPCCDARDIENAGHLQDMSVTDLVNLIYSPHPLEVSVGMAALNSQLAYDQSSVVEYNARDILLEKSIDKNVAIIGHFPFVDQFREKARQLWVLELNPRPGDYPADEYASILPQADVIGLTATTLMNGTFDDLSRCFPANALVVMMGPSTPMSPVLFDYGVDILAGSKVIDPLVLSRYISQGTTLHKVDGLKRITIARKSNL